MRVTFLPVKDCFQHFIDIFVFLCVTASCLLKLSSFRCKDNEIIATLLHLYKDNHFLVLHEVESIGVKLVWVLSDQFLDLCVKLGLHSLEEMPITDRILGVRSDWSAAGPASLWLRKPNVEECKAQIWHCSSVKHGCKQYYTNQIRKQDCELQNYADPLIPKSLLVVLEGRCKRDSHVDYFV